MHDLSQIFENNKKWAQSVRDEDPDFFQRLSTQQSPQYLWIGCADSRVPANQIMSLPPGDVFVHRNIANVVVHTDLNVLSVIQYAVEVLKVKHIILCGHYGCGGIKAAMNNTQHGLIDNWLRHIKDVERFHESELALIKAKQVKYDRLCELNVIEQTNNIINTSIVQDAFKKNQDLKIHGLIYNINDGLLNELVTS